MNDITESGNRLDEAMLDPKSTVRYRDMSPLDRAVFFSRFSRMCEIGGARNILSISSDDVIVI